MAFTHLHIYNGRIFGNTDTLRQVLNIYLHRLSIIGRFKIHDILKHHSLA